MKKTNPKLSENEIVQLLLQRDPKGINVLYDQYAELIYGLICKIVKIEDVADIVLQDTFLKIWKKIDTYHSYKGRFLTWVLNIARNTAIDMLRSKNYRESRQLTDFQGLPHEVLSNGMEIRVDDIGIRELVTRLDPKYTTIIELIYFNGYTYAEASETLNLPLGTVKSRARKAFRDLRTLLT